MDNNHKTINVEVQSKTQDIQPEILETSTIDEAKIKKNLKEILKNENVKFVIYVDDNLQDKGSFINSLIFSSLEKLKQDEGFKSLINVDFTLPDNDILIAEIGKAYTEATQETKSKLEAIIYPQSDSDQNVYNELLLVFEKEIVKAIEPKDCEAEVEKFYAELKNGEKILMLLDQDFKHGGEDYRLLTGIGLLQQLLKKDINQSIIFGMITHLITDISLEMVWRNDQVKNLTINGIRPSTFFALTKKRSTDALLLADGIKKILLNPYFEKIKELSQKVLQEAAKSMIIGIEEIDTYTFDDMIIKSSANEGVWEAETYYRIAAILLDFNIKKNMKEDSYLTVINPLFEKAYKLSLRKIGGELYKQYADPYKTKLRSKEIYEDGDIINGLHEPIANGDIFEVVIKEGETIKKEKYILLEQDCDLMLRINGKRLSKIGTLIKIKEMNVSDLSNEIKIFAEKNKHKNHYLALRGVLEYFSDEEMIGIVEFKHDLLVYIDCIDLVSINKTGEAKFDVNETYPTSCFRRSLKNRFDTLSSFWKQKSGEYLDLEKQFEILKKGVASSIIEKFLINLSPTEKNAGNIKSFDKGRFDFGIKRIKRYKHPFSEILFHRYSNFLTRVAEKHDFAENN